MVEATEAKYADHDMDACVFECLLPNMESSDSDPHEATFNLPTTNEVQLVTRWGTCCYAPISPAEAPQTQCMADGEVLPMQVHTAPHPGPPPLSLACTQEAQGGHYEGRDVFTIVSRDVRLEDFKEAQFTSLQACRVAAEVWQFSKAALDTHKEYPTR
jgi:hypothetical protein